MTNIHQKITAIRQIRRHSQQEAAQLSYISFRTYQRIESGTCSPRLSDIERLAQGFECTVEDILFFDLKSNDFPAKSRRELFLEQECEYLKNEIRRLYGVQREMVDLI